MTTLLLLIASCQATPQPVLARLDNGLRVAIIEDHTLPLVSVQVWYAVGSADDPETHPRLCESARALLATRDDIPLRLAAAGLAARGEVLPDATFFATLCPPDSLEYVIRLEARRMADAALPPASGVPIVADDCGAADPESRLWSAVLPVLLTDAPHEPSPARPEAGPDATGTMRAGIQEWLAHGFGPSNATVLIAGDVSAHEVLALIRARFGNLPPGMPPVHRNDRSTQERPHTLAVSGPPGTVAVAWQAPPLGNFEHAAIAVLMERLCNPIDGELAPACRRLGLRRLRWSARAWRNDGAVMIAADLPANANDRLARRFANATSAAVARIATRTPTAVAHVRARAMARQRAADRLDRLPERARALAEHEVVAGDLLLATLIPTQIASVGVPDVRHVAAALRDARRIIVLPQAETTAPRPPAPKNAEAIEPGPLLERIAAAAKNLPAPTPPAHHPTIAVHAAAGRSGLVVCPLPTAERVAVATRRVGPARGSPPDHGLRDAPRQDDYATFNGMTFVRGAGLLTSTCSADQVGAVLEWHWSPLGQTATTNPRPTFPPPTWRTCIAGDLSDDDVLRQARLALESLRTDEPRSAAPGLRTALRPQEPPPSRAPRTQPAGPASGFRILRQTHSDPGPGLRMRLTLPAPPGAPDRRIAWTALRIALGDVPGANDLRIHDRRPRWRCWQHRGATAQASACAGSDWPDAVRDVVRRLRLIRQNRLPATQMRTIARLTTVRHLLALDSPTAVARALAAGEDNPWQMRIETASLGRRLARLARRVSITFEVSGDIATEADVRRAATELHRER